jgi:hypothetical protein
MMRSRSHNGWEKNFISSEIKEMLYCYRSVEVLWCRNLKSSMRGTSRSYARSGCTAVR